MCAIISPCKLFLYRGKVVFSMTRLEMVEKIREKTGVTYDEARTALENANWDMLDAIVALEHKTGAAEAQSAPKATAETVQDAAPAPRKRVVRRASAGEVGDKIANVVRWIGSFIQKIDETCVEVSRKDETLFTVSVLFVIMLFILKWWVPVVLVVASLFTGYRYRITGSSMIARAANAASSKASSKAEEIREQMNRSDDDDSQPQAQATPHK